jgi:hypothetical protein
MRPAQPATPILISAMFLKPYYLLTFARQDLTTGTHLGGEKRGVGDAMDR